MSPDPQTIATQPEATLDAEAGTAAEEAAPPQSDAARELTDAAAASAEALDSYSRTVSRDRSQRGSCPRSDVRCRPARAPRCA